MTEDNTNKKVAYYGADWQEKKYPLISSESYYDVMVADGKLFLVEMNKFSAHGWFMFIGFVLLNVLGLLVGGYLGKRKDQESRKDYRSKWIDGDARLISHKYKENIFLEIKLGKLGEAITFDEKRIKIGKESKKITLTNESEEVDKFKKALKRNLS